MKIILLMKQLLLLLIAFFSIGAGKAYQENYSTPIRIGRHFFDTEIADTPKKMQQGMMFRTKIADSQAMLFVYSQSQRAHFWMKNTLVPLDMLFFDELGRLQEIKHNVPPCKREPCDIYHSTSDNIQFIVELKGGVSEMLGIQVGDTLRQ